MTTCPDCWGMGTTKIEKELNSVQKGKIYFVFGRLEQPRQNKILLYRHGKPNEPTKEGPLSFVLFESQFTSVSTVSRGHPSQVSLAKSHPQFIYMCFL
jgi:hypothetical protein